MSLRETTEAIAVQISADPSRENLERCLQNIRSNQRALAAAQSQMNQTLYEVARAREMAEAMQETNLELEARVHLLLGAYDR
jgi:chromosome segregation ATPase